MPGLNLNWPLSYFLSYFFLLNKILYSLENLKEVKMLIRNFTLIQCRDKPKAIQIRQAHLVIHA